MQSLMRLIYPAQCLTCDEMVEEDFSLCGSCWRETVFLNGTRCQSCGISLPGEAGDALITCDDCLRGARPWRRGASALLYKGNGRKLVMALKHGDRTELARPAAHWMVAAFGRCEEQALIIPVPLHRLRFLRRRYNQAALLAQEIAKLTGLQHLPDALLRRRPTKQLDGHSREARFEMLAGAISANPRYKDALKGRKVLLIDDVMTTGATLAACTEACTDAGADHVDVLTLARVAKDG